MGCPLCGADQVRRDYAPARGYAITLAGAALLFLRGLFSPLILAPQFAVADDQRLWIVGGAVFLYGLYNLVRHGNRYCGACGYRFRATPTNCGAGDTIGGGIGALAAKFGGMGMPAVQTRPARQEPEEKPSGAIRYEPVLACLKFKNPAARAEAARTLAEATGQDFGEDYEGWKAWLVENKKIRG